MDPGDINSTKTSLTFAREAVANARLIVGEIHVVGVTRMCDCGCCCFKSRNAML